MKSCFIRFAVRQISYFNYKVDDIDKRQAVGGVMEALNKEATYGLADEMDKHIAGMAATREAVKYAASATAITKDNVLGEIDKALEKLYGNNVRPNGKIMMEVPPWFYMRLKQAYTALDTDNSKMLENGRVGKYGNDTLITGGGLVEYDLQLIGARLQAARKAKGYTQDYVSARADITEKFLSQIERGKAGLSVQTLIALCDILEITPNYVLLPDAARVLEEPIGPLLKGMSQRQLQDVEEMVRIFVRNCRHEEKGRPRGGRRNMR